MADQPSVTFAELLKQLRTGAHLTQDELSLAAQISSRAVSNLERGVNTAPRKDTARLLADALQLTGAARARFEAVASGRAAPGEPAAATEALAATRTLPRDLPDFTGREAELQELMDAVTSAAGSAEVVAIQAIGGMAGIGKTAFAVHAAHRLATRFPDGQMFLALYGHTPGHQPVAPADALTSLLLAAGVDARQIPAGLDARAALWRNQTAGRRLLLVLDDAAGTDQISPLLPGTAQCLVLVTSRRHLTALEGARAVSLDLLAADKAAELLVRLAARPGLAADDPGVAEIVRLCGYLPLAVGILASQLHHHSQWDPAEVAAELAAAQSRLALMRAENLSVAAAFDLSYRDLAPAQQRLFRRMGLHPGTEIDAHAAAALNDVDIPVARGDLEALYEQHLLIETARGRYRLHDLIREHAGIMASTDEPAERDGAVTRLLDYYLYTARAADRQLSWVSPGLAPGIIGHRPAGARDISTREEAFAWMDAERSNLNSVVNYAAEQAHPGHAIAIPAAMSSYLRIRGHWDQAIGLYRTAVRTARRAGDRAGEAAALNRLGYVESQALDPQAAIASLTRALELYRGVGDRHGEAETLTEMGGEQAMTGKYAAAAGSLRQALELYRDLGDRRGEADAHCWLGGLQQEIGEFRAALASQQEALALYRGLGDQHGEVNALNGLGEAQALTGDLRAAAASQELALSVSRRLGILPGQANSLAYLGKVQAMAGGHSAAAQSLTRALAIYRDLGNRLSEAFVLNYLASVQQATKDFAAASASLAEALQVHRKLGNKPGEAEALNTTGDLLLESSDLAQAGAHYEQALSIANEICSPLEAARAHEGIGLCKLREGRRDEGVTSLRGALDIYTSLGSPNARRVQATLRDCGA